MSLKTLATAGLALTFCWVVNTPSQARAEAHAPEKLCITPGKKEHDNDSKYVAYGFPGWGQLVESHRALLSQVFSTQSFTGQVVAARSDLSAGLPGTEVFSLQGLSRGLASDEFSVEENQSEMLYDRWLTGFNSQASTFFALAHALKNIFIEVAPDTKVDFYSIITHLKEVKGDRLTVIVQKDAFESWVNRGAPYWVRGPSGEFEHDKITFKDRTTFYGGLHCGYDIQGYTNRKIMPRVQWNYRFKDSEVDIDIDGYRTVLWNFIPNPRHFTYRNSDVRFWFKTYLHRFGPPGFWVRKRK